MTDVAAMLLAYPGKLEHFDQDELVLCIQECLNCADVTLATTRRGMRLADTHRKAVRR